MLALLPEAIVWADVVVSLAAVETVVVDDVYGVGWDGNRRL